MISTINIQRELNKIGSVTSILMASALKKASICDFSAVELQEIDKIKNLRANLLNSNEVISFIRPDGSLNRVRRSIKYITKKAVTSDDNALLMFSIVRKFKPEISLDMGTGLGLAASYLAAAIKLNERGRITTIEAVPEIAKFAKSNFNKLNYNVDQATGLFQDILQQIINKLNKLDFVFMGGHLERNARLKYFSQILPFLSDTSIIICNGVNRNKGGMSKVWQEMIKFKDIKISFTIGPMGYCLLDNNFKGQIKIN